jgi:hypothetical protein
MSVLNCEEIDKPNRAITICLESRSSDNFSRYNFRTDTNPHWKTVEKRNLGRAEEDAYVPQVNSQEELVQYEDLFIEINGFQEDYSEVYPWRWLNSPINEPVSPMAKPCDDLEVAALRFPAGLDEKDDFVILFERWGGLGRALSVNYFQLSRAESLVGAVQMYGKKAKEAKEARIEGVPPKPRKAI